MADWWLECSDGSFRKARIEPATLSDTRRMKWTFDWRKELHSSKRKVYKLVDDHNGSIIGGISFEIREDHIYVVLLDSASPTRYNANPPRFYLNVMKLLLAFASLESDRLGFDGFLALTPKTKLQSYYHKHFCAFLLPQGMMGINGGIMKAIIELYYY